MIYGNINAKETEAAYTPVIRKALDILRALNFAPTTRPKDGEAMIWRRRNEKPRPQAVTPPPPEASVPVWLGWCRRRSGPRQVSPFG